MHQTAFCLHSETMRVPMQQSQIKTGQHNDFCRAAPAHVLATTFWLVTKACQIITTATHLENMQPITRQHVSVPPEMECLLSRLQRFSCSGTHNVAGTPNQVLNTKLSLQSNALLA